MAIWTLGALPSSPKAPRCPVGSSGHASGRAELIARWALLLAAAFVLAAGGSALAEGNDLLPPEVEANFEADFTPKALPKREQAPVALRAAMEFMKSDKSHPPALKEFEIEGDRHLRLNLQGVPVCHGLGIQDGIPLQQKCKEALIGTGRMFINIQFQEQEPFVTRSKVSIYNDGVKDGRRNLLLATYITAPTPAAVVSTVAVKKVSDSRYGLNLVGSVPKIAGGAGSVIRLALRFHKGIFSAACADGRLQTGFGFTFVEGTRLGGAVLRHCTVS